MKGQLLKTILACAITCWGTVLGAPITWIALDPNNDMEDSFNWNPATVPGSGDEAIFDSTIPNIAFNPTESTAPFSVLSFNFIQEAFPFNFQFNNQTLSFVGAGIIGTNTDAFIDISNIDNSTSLVNLLSFTAAQSTSGSAQIFVANNANLSGSFSNTTIGAVSSLSHASGIFALGDDGVISVRNTGDDSANGTGNNNVANMSSTQMRFDSSATMEELAFMGVSNNGTFSGNNTVTSDKVANITGSQFLASGAFQAGIESFIDVRNEGTDQGLGVGGDLIANISGNQVAFLNGLELEDGFGFSIENRGTSFSNNASGSTVGCLTGDSHQLFVKVNFQAGDDFSLFMQNVGNINSTGAGGDTVGCISTLGNAASQFHLDAGGTVGDGVSIFMLNTGNRTVSNVSAASKGGVIDGQQFYSAGIFQAGNNLNLQAINGGSAFGPGQNNHTLGTVGRSQVEFGDICILGENVLFNIVNTGFNIDLTGTSNSISVINGCQFKAGGNFTAGNNLLLLATNQSQNFGDASNDVGLVNDSQISFEQQCNLNNGSIISARNTGTVANCQIEFLQGFNVLSGKALIGANNSGTLGCFGIEILGSNAGGNAEILLINSSLSIDTTLPIFTIGGLSGDSTSFAESNPTLIIDTDSSTVADFSGAIQDFPTSMTSVIKAGPGTQILSGINTYTGLTTVQGGDLVINGSIAKDLFVNTLGTLKGIGTIGGNVTNSGTISPGESIGTLNILGNYVNNLSGIYAVEVNGAGFSDLINVTGQTDLIGGKVVVTSEDGIFQFQQPYTIVTAQGGVIGTYEGAVSSAFIDPILTYDFSNVYLTIESDLLKAAETCNQTSVATILDAIINPNSFQSHLLNELVNLPLEEAQRALESLSGFQYTHDVWMTEIAVRRFLRNLYNPLRETSCHDLTKVWLETGQIFTHLHGKNARKAHADSFHVTGGIQKAFPSNLTLGLAGSYEYDFLSFREGRSRRYSRFLAAYGLYDACPYYGLFDLVYGHTYTNLKRSLHLHTLFNHVQSKPKIDLATFYGEGGFDLYFNCFLLQPFVGIQIGKNWRDHIKENGLSGLNLNIHKHDWSSTSSRLGIHLTANHFYNCFDASFDLAWNQLLSSPKNRTKGRFTEFGKSFSICGNSLNRSSIDYALSVSLCLCDCLKGYVEGSGEKWKHASTYEIQGGLEYSW